MQMRVSPPLVVLVSLLLTAPARGHALESEVDPNLARRLKRIEAAFREGDAGSLRSSFSSAAKVHVDLRDLSEGQGSYGSGQLQVIFDRIFEHSPTEDFAFGADDVRILTPGTASARGRWVRRLHARNSSVDVLTFTLRQESGDWRILEIRSSRW